LHSGFGFIFEYMQKTAALYFCTPDSALFLNICKKSLRFIFALRIYETFRYAESA